MSSRPGTLLLILLILATGAGWALKAVHDRNTAPKPLSPADPTDASGQTDPAKPELAESSGTREMESTLLNEAFQLSKGRSLAYQEALSFIPTSAAAIQRAWQRQRNALYSSETLKGMGLSMQLLGMLPEDEDLTARYRLRASLSTDVYYDPQDGKLLHTETLDTNDPESKEWLARHLMGLLLDQNFRWRESLLPTEVNLDRALAQQAFVAGDITWHALQHTKADVARSHAWKRTDTLTNNWPKVLREIEFLGMREGVHFCQAISGQDVVLDSVYQQIPTSTAHLLHPDRFLEIPRWQPKVMKWAQLDLLGSEPVWTNVMGELVIRAWLETATLAEDASLIAALWEGDGVLLYQTNNDAPQLAWKSLWRSESSAQRFFNLVRAQAQKLFGVSIPTQQTPDSIVYGDLLGLKIKRDGASVTILRWTEEAWLAALEDLASRSSFGN